MAESFPSLYKFVARCCFLPPGLCFQQKMNIKCILSEEGVQQGDPLGRFLFALALQPCLRVAAEECSKGLVVSYLDDAVIEKFLSAPTIDTTPSERFLGGHHIFRASEALGNIRPLMCKSVAPFPAMTTLCDDCRGNSTSMEAQFRRRL